ncbi:hypothetical protein CDEST_03497 [Colletotrichum destructivum]|uniref:Uncharacterized protein n=1 Tax=Colletotrichum destructivum TaxID=34406 RepID=A0AAX4I560_9PEZI|nr:hypothetical protein CDEST_03497 [Colletotrichum destructivum]
MASTTPQQGSVNTETQAARTVSQQEAQSQRDARIRDFLSDRSLGRAQGTAAAAAVVANVDRLGLGSGNDGATHRSPTHEVPVSLRGAGSQFQK